MWTTADYDCGEDYQMCAIRKKTLSEIRVPEWIMVLVSFVPVVVSVVAVCIYWGQLAEMKKASLDTHTAASAAKDAADIAGNTLKSNAKSASDTILEMQKQSEAMQKAASAADRQASATLAQVASANKALVSSMNASRLDQRAWIGVRSVTPWVDEHGKIGAEMLVENTGRTPALNVKVRENIEPLANKGLWHEEPKYHEDYSDTHFLLNDSRSVVEPSGGFHIFVSINGYWMDGVTDTLHGRIAYDDVFGCHHWIVFCYSKGFNPKTTVPLWTSCSIHNEIDLIADELNCKSKQINP
jgi:hypothetical protein